MTFPLYTANLDDFVMTYADTGGDKPVVVLVHGFPLDHTMWQFQLDGLADTHRLVSPDLRGFGVSHRGTKPLSMRTHADDLANLIDAIGISEPVTFCGLSMGGYIGWEFLAHHYSRVGHVIMCDTRAANDDEVTARARTMMAAKVLTEGSHLAAEAMVPKLFAEAAYTDNAPIVEATQSVILNTSPETISETQIELSRRMDARGLLAEIDLPTLLICGEHDQISRADEMREISQMMPKALFSEVAGAGHMAPLEKPVEVNRLICQFIQSS